MFKLLFSPPTLEAMGKMLPAYDFAEVISSNMKGAVYFAVQRSLDRQVAIKLRVLEPLVGAENSAEVSSRKVAGLKHPNIVSVFDSGQVEEMCYTVLEFVPGKSLARSTIGKVVEFDQSMEIIRGICEGIAHAHASGIFHGNLNPANVLLNQKAEPKIMNFGSIPIEDRALGEGDPFRFASPEVMKRSEPTAASDVYSLGAMFYELITGREFVHDGKPASSLCKCKKEIDEVIKEATDLAPDRRTSDVKVFMDALDKAASGNVRRTLASASNMTDTSRVAIPTAVGSVQATGSVIVMKKKGGFDSNMALKIFVIIILLVAVQQMWGFLNTTKEERAQENREILAKAEADKERRLAASKEVKILTPNHRPNIRPNEPDVVIEDKKESSEESLSRLRASLVSGQRSMMPVGTLRIGDSDFLLVAKQMTWNEAAVFAEEHGGHLLTSTQVLSQLPKDFADGKSFWIGAGWNGSSWSLLDGGKMDGAPEGTGTHAIVKGDGKIAAADGGDRYTFVIQWRTDGSNPGKFVTQLGKTRASLTKGSPFFPAGTILEGGRRFLHVSRKATWEEAIAYAKDGGGNLMVVSSDDEAALLKKLVSKFKRNEFIWLGASLEGLYWKWVTGETWSNAQWSDSDAATEDGVALAVGSKSEWDPKDRDESASGFIIEWSEDAAKATKANEELGKDVEELVSRAKDLVEVATEKRKAAHTANDDKLKWDLNGYIKTMNKSGQDQWSPVIEHIKGYVGDDRIVSEQMEEDDMTVPQDMARFILYHGRKQGEIDTQYTAELDKIREAFVTKLTGIRDTEKKAGQIKAVQEHEELLEDAEDLDTWENALELDIHKINRDENDDEDEDADEDED